VTYVLLAIWLAITTLQAALVNWRWKRKRLSHSFVGAWLLCSLMPFMLPATVVLCIRDNKPDEDVDLQRPGSWR
jgi:hypothetical protein